MSNFDDIIKAGLENLGDQYVHYLTQELIKADKRSSGRLINSLNASVKPIGEGLFTLIIESEDYLKYVDQGRRPGKYVPVRALEDWVRVRGIPKTAVFPINQKIFRFGIKPTFVISKAQKQLLNNIDIIDEAYLEYASSIITANIKQKFK